MRPLFASKLATGALDLLPGDLASRRRGSAPLFHPVGNLPVKTALATSHPCRAAETPQGWRVRTDRTFENRLERLRRRVRSAQDLGKLYRIVAEGFARLLGAERVLLLHELDCMRGPEVVYATPAPAAGQDLPSANIPREDPLYSFLEKTTRAFVLLDDPRFREAVGDSAALQRLHELGEWKVAVPLRQVDVLVGVVLLGAVHKLDVAFHYRRAIRRLAELIAYACVTLLMFQRLQQEAKEKTTLLEVAKKISSSLELKEVLEMVVEAVRQVVPCDHATVFLIDRERDELKHVVYRGSGRAVARGFRLKLGQGLVGWVAITGQPVLIDNVLEDERYYRLFPDSRSELDVPLVRGDRILGVISLESRRERAFNEHHLELAKAFAAQAAIAIENALLLDELVEKRRLERELSIAREIQKALLPKELPRLRGFKMDAYTLPSGMIGGDLYDVVQFADRSVALAVGDVSGKGTPGAILMATLYSTYRGLLRRGIEPASLMRKLNNLLVERIDPESFATFFLALLDPRKRSLHYCNAGHNPPILVRQDGSYERLEEGGPVLGFLPELSYISAKAELKPGDVLVLYTDGVTEAANAEDELFGEERLISVVRRNRGLGPRRLRKKIIQEVVSFTGRKNLDDDLTLLIVKAASRPGNAARTVGEEESQEVMADGS